MAVSGKAKLMLEKGYKFCEHCGAWRKPCYHCNGCPHCGYSVWRKFGKWWEE